MELNRKPQTENEQRIAEEYLSSLADLNCNSKPLINMLTMLAEENIDCAAIIVKVVEQHIAQVPTEFKLPILYLIDSIVKNVKGTYVQLFSQCIVNIFCGVFEMVHEKIRERMYALRQTWNEVFSPQKLYALDIKVKRLDGNWPITAKQPPKPSIHVNPDFLKNVNATQTALPSEMEEILQVKTRELLELKKRKLELELEQTKKHLEEQEQQLNQTTSSMAAAPMPQPVAGGVAFAPGMNARMAAPGIAPQELLLQQQQQQQKMAALRPGFVRSARPAQQAAPGQHERASGNLPIQGQGFPQVNNVTNNKPKVNPVNPALLNSMRQRDPRLARQSQQQQQQPAQQQHQHLPPPSSRSHADGRNDGNKASSSSSSTNRHGSDSKSSRSRSKSPTRHTSSSSHRSTGSSSRSHKSSSSRRGGSTSDKDRKRSESKSSTASSSSSSSTTSDRRKGVAFSTSPSSLATTAHDNSSVSATLVKSSYDTFDIESFSGPAHKRKSSSPAASPSKSKRAAKSTHRSNNKSTRSRSRSPNDYKDVDMRTAIMRSNLAPEKRVKLDLIGEDNMQTCTTAATGASNNTTNDLEKPKFNVIERATLPIVITSSSMDIDLRKLAPPPPLAPSVTAFALPKLIKSCTQNAFFSTTTTTTTAITTINLTQTKTTTTTKTSDASSSSSSLITPLSLSLSLSSSSSLPSASPSTSSSYSSDSSTELLSKICTKSSNTATAGTTNNSSTSSSNSTTNTNPTTTTTTTIKTLPSKVSFKIQKPFNKLEKSTANATFGATTTTTATTTVASTSSGAMAVPGNVSDALKESINKLMTTAQYNKEQQQQQQHHTQHAATGEKRISTTTTTTLTDLVEPAQKKSKPTKMDMLFGSEDVDLRKEILMTHTLNAASSQKKAQSGITTPPPMSSSATAIDVEDEHESELKPAENWHNEKSPPKRNTTTLDEIRAKLAKTARSNKIKNEKVAKDQAQRFKLAELNINDDSQEANDENIRVILTQAQEMFDNKDMNQDQYKDLVHKMMSINETGKLRQAKRREAALKSSGSTDDSVANDFPEDRERNAARDAVLRKRIPKIKSVAQANENNTANDSPRSDGGNDSPIYEDVAASVDDNAAAGSSGSSKPHGNNKKEKRRKPSKWGEQIDTNAGQRSNWLPVNAAAANNNNNKRAGTGGFRAQQQMPMPNNMRLNTPMPWQRGTGMAQQPFGGTMIGGTRSAVPPPPQPPNMICLPTVASNIPKPCNSIDNPQADIMRSITIDGTSKEIRIYNQVAIVFMQGDVPHEIGFQPGQRALIIDNMEPFTLQFNDVYKPITIDGILHHIRFGFPSRELYIDDQWYEIYFGGPQVSIPIRNKLHVLKAEGPPPQVNIGAVRRDLVVGKISMIVDAYTIIPLFLDSKVQTFPLGDQQHVIQFVDSFVNVLFDGELHKVEYGGLPKSISLGGRKYFIRFGTLPPGIVAGKVHVQDMVYIKTEAPLPESINSAQGIGHAGSVNRIGNELKTEAIAESAVAAPTTTTATTATAPVPAAATAAALGNLNIDELFQKLVSSGIINGAAPVAATTLPVSKVADDEVGRSSTPVTVQTTTEPNAKSADVPPAALSPVPPAEVIHPIILSKSETIKTRQAAIISTLYSGMQCSSCGVRFPPEQTIKYSQHLDWHFRQNRRERDSSRKALSRKWYYGLNDWIQYEEIEDLEERDKNFLEAQQNGPEAFDEGSNQRSLGSPVPSCAAGPNDVDRACDMCQEKFEQFYNEELEEWHLRSAVRVEDKIYHPLCYEDYKASLKPPPIGPEKTEEETKKERDLNTIDDNAVDIVIKIESEDKDDSKVTANDMDYDDDVIVLPNEEPSVMEIIDDDGDDDEYVPANVTREEMGTAHHENEQENQQQQHSKILTENMEADVEIQEPHIPFTDLDNYVEKELPPLDEATRAALLNVKIKEEPKDEYDEDDGFEDVGTVMLMPGEEISIQSSEDTQTHTIASSASPATIERPPSVASLTQNDALELEPATPEPSTIDLNASMDGNLESQETHNLSAVGPPPALPLASLVNKIKINITKNTSSSNSNNNNSNNSASNTAVSTTKSSSTSSTTTTTAAAETNVFGIGSVVSNSCNSTTITTATSADSKANCSTNSGSSSNSINTNNLGEVNNIQTISTIPVLCGGSTVVPKITTSSCTGGGTGSAPANISTISVIGSSSYGISNTRFAAMMSKPTITPSSMVSSSSSTTTTSMSATTSSSAATALPKPVPVTRQATPPPPAEPEPTIVFKPALRNTALKKTKKIVNGVETSGLCSIM